MEAEVDAENSTSRKTRWIVSAGEYSDYSVWAVCDSRETAEAVAKRMQPSGSGYYSTWRAEEVAYVDDPSFPRVELLTMRVGIDSDGTARSGGAAWFQVEWPFDGRENWPDCEWEWEGCGRFGWGQLTVRGTDHKRVRKVFGERRALVMTDDAFRSVPARG